VKSDPGVALAHAEKWRHTANSPLKAPLKMVCLMSFINHSDGRLEDNSSYVGWVDCKTNEPVDDKDVKGRYEKEVLLHAGIRLIGTNTFVSFEITLTLSLQNPSFSVVMTPTRRSSTKKSSSSTILSQLRFLN